MTLYQPQQHLGFLKVNPILTLSNKEEEDPKTYLKSTISVLVNGSETLTRIYDKEPLRIVFRTIRDDKWQEKHIVDKVVLIDKALLGSYKNYIVKVIVYKMDGSEGGQVTSTISEDDTIEIEE